MTLALCIARLRDEAALSKAQAQEAQDLFDASVDNLRAGGLTRVQAEAQAGGAVVSAIEQRAKLNKRHKLMSMAIQRDIAKQLTTFKGKGDGLDMARAALALLTHDDRAPYSNVEGVRRAVRNRAHAHMNAVLEKFHRNITGDVQNIALLKEVVQELHGNSSGNATAAELAKAFTETSDWLRLQFNMAGGAIPKRADWGMPQGHDWLAVRTAAKILTGTDGDGAANKRAWINYIRPLLDPAKMRDAKTGLPMSSQALELALNEVWETISTEGWNKINPSSQRYGLGKLGSQRLDHRFLVFKDADSWLAYHDTFGMGTAYDVMLGHIDGMARDIAQLKILGPNPQATITWLQQLITKGATMQDSARGGTKLRDGVRTRMAELDRTFQLLAGKTDTPVHEGWAKFMSSTRSVLASAQLGGAVISSMTDLGFQFLAADFNGLSYGNIIGNYARLLNPSNAQDRTFARAAGLGADGFTQMLGGMQRYLNEVQSHEVARRLATGVMKVTGLEAWTNAGRHAMGLEIMQALARESGKALDKVDPLIARLLERHGIGPDTWDQLRGTALHEHQGVKHLRAEDVASNPALTPKEADRLATRLLEVIASEQEFAVPTVSARGRAFLSGGNRPGTIAGELERSFLQYKGFAVTVMFLHLNRLLALHKGSRAGYIAKLTIATTVMGGLAMTLKDIAKGQNPRDATQIEFWGAALAQGGGLGILGDFLYASTSERSGGGVAGALAGPLAGLAQDSLALVFGNAAQGLSGDDMNLGRETVRYLKRYTPGSSIWWARKGLNALVWDNLQRLADPDAQESFDRTAARAEREMNTDYWWGPGELTPDSAPDVTRLAGGVE